MRALIAGAALVFAVLATPQAAQNPVPNAGAAKHRAVLDQYCVTCHNDRLKTSNLSLEKLDLATAGERLAAA